MEEGETPAADDADMDAGEEGEYEGVLASAAWTYIVRFLLHAVSKLSNRVVAAGLLYDRLLCR